ncbi:MAG: hypothetical protein CMF42_05915 [Legionellales bacterium]|nr:hypothetical protein [Legionellales bacterium]OUX66947.1 MAG: hypothetical protein CBD38_04260 [bacterium TMED178]|tara:strand:- start:1013 stop:1447 length:435 start_codon:yes stop_codon:yes gene_type:complete
MIDIIKRTSRDIYDAFSGLAFFAMITAEQTWNYVISFFWTPQELTKDVSEENLESPSKCPEKPEYVHSAALLSHESTTSFEDTSPKDRRFTMEMLMDLLPPQGQSDSPAYEALPSNLMSLLEVAATVVETSVSGSSPEKFSPTL